MIAMSLRDLQEAVHIICVASFGLNLNGGMRNPEVVFQLFGYRAQNVLAAPYALFFDGNVTATGNNACTDRPNVQVMNGKNACDAADFSLDCLHVDVFGNAFQQNVDRFSENAPGTP